MTPYKEGFFKDQQQAAKLSAGVVVPLLLEWIAPTSVIDIGCGVGTWLRVLQEHGVSDFLGVDGAYVNRDWLEIPQAQFVSHDLNEAFSAGRRFTLALCLEVAEHLSPERAPSLVQDLVDLAPVVVFSAAVPGQGGVAHL